jgi:hypothetical protein
MNGDGFKIRFVSINAVAGIEIEREVGIEPNGRRRPQRRSVSGLATGAICPKARNTDDGAEMFPVGPKSVGNTFGKALKISDWRVLLAWAINAVRTLPYKFDPIRNCGPVPPITF